MALLRRLMPDQEVYSGFDENVAHFLASAPPAASHVVLKCHTLDPVGRILAQTGAAKVIYTLRNIADATVSFITMFEVEFEHAIAVMRSSLELHRFHQKSGNAAIVGYEDITAHSEQAIQGIAAYLGLDASLEVVREIAEETSFERMREKVEQINTISGEGRLAQIKNIMYDPGTLLNLHHIRDGRSGYGHNSLTAQQLRCIDALVREYGVIE